MKSSKFVTLLISLSLPIMPMAVIAQDTAASSILMQSLASGLAKGVGSEISKESMGWAMSSLGLDSDPNAEIVAALHAIETTLAAIENELADIDEILAQQSCSNEAADVQAFLDMIDLWAGRGNFPVNGSYASLVNQAQDGIDVTDEMSALYDKVLNGDGLNPSLETLLLELNNGLIDQGVAEQLITTCGLLIDPPNEDDDFQWDDREYFQRIHNLLNFYFNYQARAVLLVVEAYHSVALQAWLDAGNDPNSILPEELPQICDAPSGAVATACSAAQIAFDFVVTNLRAQYGLAGASYSTGSPDDPTGVNKSYTCKDASSDYGLTTCDDSEPRVQIRRTTGTVWVKDISEFFVAGGYSSTCNNANSATPCGPGLGNYDHTTFEKHNSADLLQFGANGGYTTWEPALTSDWEDLTPGWSGGSTTYGDYLADRHNFTGTTTDRVFFTSDVNTGTFQVTASNSSGANVWHFKTHEVACFISMTMNKNNFSGQPFCSSGFGNLMHTSKDHTSSSAPCYNALNKDHGTLQDAGITAPFFEFFYTMREGKCKSGSHPLGQTFYQGPPGWLLKYESFKTDEGDRSQETGVVSVNRADYDKQYHWPTFSAFEATCTVEPLTGQTRSRLSLNGHGVVPRLCGADFDAWFDTWIVPPATPSSAPQLTTPGTLEITVPPGSTYPAPHHEVLEIVHHEHLVDAYDEEDGPLPATCFPMSGSLFQLGTTQVTCSATDSAGNTTTEAFTVHVQYPFEFLGQLDETTTLKARAGRTIRVAFSLGGKRGLDIINMDLPFSEEIDCANGEIIGPVDFIFSQHESPAKNGNHAHSFQWATKREWDGQCRQLVVDLVDGTNHMARVEF